jgi:hypothetical protein
MSPSAKYRLDGTVMRYAREVYVTPITTPLQLACRNASLTLRSHGTAQHMLILRRGDGCHRGPFFVQLPFGTGSGTPLVIMSNGRLEARPLWLKRKDTQGRKLRLS